MSNSVLNMKQKKTLWGIEEDTINWKLPLSLFCAFLLSSFITYVLQSVIADFSISFKFIISNSIFNIIMVGSIIAVLKFVQAKVFLHLIIIITVVEGVFRIIVQVIFYEFVFSFYRISFFVLGLIFTFLFIYLSVYYYGQTKNKWGAIGIGFTIASFVNIIIQIILLLIQFGDGSHVLDSFKYFLIISVFFVLILWGMHLLLKINQWERVDLPLQTTDLSSIVTREDKVGFFAPEKGAMQKGVLGGIAVMVIAVVWFFVGLSLDWVFFYPPILFLIGLIGFIRGIIQGNLYGEKKKDNKQNK